MVNFNVAKKKSESSKSIVSFFGPYTKIEGDVHSDASIHLEGQITGAIYCNHDVIVGEQCLIEGQIKAKNVIVSGKVIGNIIAVNSLEVSATGVVEGDITGNKLTIQEGGIYKGKVNMDVIQSQSLYEDTFQIVRK